MEPAQAPQPIREQGSAPRDVAARYGRLRPLDESHQTQQPQVALPDDLHPDLVRTALCIEAREGRLYCFLPPLTHLEHWLDLALCLEDTAAELKMPIIIEGYEPPRDPRLNKLAVTPDPGVIEVNIHPAESWDQMVRDLHMERCAASALPCSLRCGKAGFRPCSRGYSTGSEQLFDALCRQSRCPGPGARSQAPGAATHTGGYGALKAMSATDAAKDYNRFTGTVALGSMMF